MLDVFSWDIFEMSRFKALLHAVVFSCNLERNISSFRYMQVIVWPHAVIILQARSVTGANFFSNLMKRVGSYKKKLTPVTALGNLNLINFGGKPCKGLGTLETLDFTIRIGSTPIFSHFDLYLNTAYAAHYIYIYSRLEFWPWISNKRSLNDWTPGKPAYIV